jgi:hypothetical protein
VAFRNPHSSPEARTIDGRGAEWRLIFKFHLAARSAVVGCGSEFFALELSMRLYLVLVMGFSLGAIAAVPPSKCQVLDRSILSRTPSGMPVVSNVMPIEMACTAPARPLPASPGDSRNGLRAATTAIEVASDGSKKPVPTQTEGQGGGRGEMYGATASEEFVTFYIFIPLETTERDAEISRYLDRFEAASKDGVRLSEAERQQLHERVAYLKSHPQDLPGGLNQNRLGHFEVECRVRDGDRVAAVGSVELEVVFKGRVSDAFPPRVERTH